MTREYEFVKEALRFMFKKNVFGFRDSMPEEFQTGKANEVINDASVELYLSQGDGDELADIVDTIKVASMMDEYKSKAAELLLKYGDIISANTKEGVEH